MELRRPGDGHARVRAHTHTRAHPPQPPTPRFSLPQPSPAQSLMVLSVVDWLVSLHGFVHRVCGAPSPEAAIGNGHAKCAGPLGAAVPSSPASPSGTGSLPEPVFCIN